VGLILGSGLAGVASHFEVSETAGFEETLRIPLDGKVPPLGHHRRVLRARHKGRELWILEGRLHYYEGFPMETVVEPVRYLAGQGAKTLVFSFAAGAVNPRIRPGDLIVVTDHLHGQSANPLRGSSQFVDCTQVYDPAAVAAVLRIAKKLKVRAHPGVYASLDGPSYETPAEIRALRRLGADAVGMSLTAEAIMAKSLGLRVVGLGWASNMAAGARSKAPLTHAEVLERGKEAAESYARVLRELLEIL